MKLVPTFIRHRFAQRQSFLNVIENIGWLFFDKIIRMGIGLIVTIWIVRYLGPDQFGLLSFAISFVGLFGAIAGLGLHDIVVREIIRDPTGDKEILGTAAVVQFIGGISAYALSIVTIFWLRPDDQIARILVAILGSMMIFRVSDVAIFWFEAHVKSKYMVWVQSGTFLVFSVVKVALILNDFALIAFAWISMAEGLLVAILMLTVLGFHGPSLLRFQVTMSRAKNLVLHSWPLFLSGMAILIYMKIDQIMLGQMVGDRSVGFYSAAVRISEVFYLAPMAIISSVFPAILQTKIRSETQYYDRLQKLFDILVWISFAFAIPVTFLSNFLVALLYGSDFFSASIVLAIHVWAIFFVLLGVAGAKWILAENRQILSLQRAILGMISNVLLNYLLIPNYAEVGAAIATVISQSAAAFFIDAFQMETRKIFFMKLKSFNLYSSYGRIRRAR
jgi:O-antigen/teichoic acid export membrane protein